MQIPKMGLSPFEVWLLEAVEPCELEVRPYKGD